MVGVWTPLRQAWVVVVAQAVHTAHLRAVRGRARRTLTQLRAWGAAPGVSRQDHVLERVRTLAAAL